MLTAVSVLTTHLIMSSLNFYYQFMSFRDYHTKVGFSGPPNDLNNKLSKFCVCSAVPP